MKIILSESSLWKRFFFGLILGYCLYYAPFGVNETDGGFLTGLAWQWLNGKVLYQDIIYVRPPLPVWMRGMEIICLPEQVEILGERWFFYGKVGLYSWLAASLLYRGKQRWMLATFGFVISAHCYPAMAWHTVDGILFAVLAVYLFFKPYDAYKGALFAGFSGIALFAAMLCKQSFYPLFPVFALLLFWHKRQKALVMLSALFISMALFGYYLFRHDLLHGFLKMTNGSTDHGLAFQHGVLDYFMITPELSIPSLGLLATGVWLYKRDKSAKWLPLMWGFWLFALVVSFALVTWLRQEHTVPIAQSRAMFWVGAIFILSEWWRFKGQQETKPLIAILLLSITWCAAISWGYSFPLLFSTPWIWAAMELSDRLQSKPKRFTKVFPLALLIALLLVFRLGYEFVYRDGKRAEMIENMGTIFPKLSGIYSDRETAARYQDLKRLAARYGPNFKVLPAFPQANYLTGSAPPLPLDWVVNRETNGDNELVFTCLSDKNPVLFFEKSYLEKLSTDPELIVARTIFDKTALLEETPFFVVRH